VPTEKPRGQPKPPAVQPIAPTLNSPGYALWIPEWFPALTNKLLTCHWAKAGRLKQADKDVVALYFGRSGIPTALSKRRVDLHFIVPEGKRRWDEDAAWKSGLDSLAACQALRDDGPKWCKQGDVFWSRAMSEAWGTQILLRDL
jgi:hypothetical protein